MVKLLPRSEDQDLDSWVNGGGGMSRGERDGGMSGGGPRSVYSHPAMMSSTQIEIISLSFVCKYFL